MISGNYEPESASNFFRQMCLYYDEKCSERKYLGWHHIFNDVINGNTNFEHLRLIGPFAKTDYLLKEKEADHSLRKAVNEARIRFRRNADGRLSEEEREENAPYDFKAVCLFIALVYGVDVPDDVRDLFPTNRPLHTAAIPMNDSLRIIVDRWDDDYIYGTLDTEDVQEVKVCYSGQNSRYPYDWTYIRQLLSPHCQLNILRPRESEGALWPELIIFEPDYLVDISSIAGCFEEYAHTPYVYLLNKIKPSANSQAILLGNFAGQLLDEEVHGDAQHLTYSQSIKEFYKTNALNLLTAGVKSSFHNDAQKQKVNIHNAIGKALPAAVRGYDARQVMVEPSFFSEMLGLQGRMDFMQLDQSVLIEQKSGKGGFPQRDPSTPVHQLKHYVQMLLYVALLRYNFREQYDRNNHDLHAFLLYSRYENSLISLGYAPELVFEAIKLRNGIVWNEMLFGKGGIDVIGKLTPENMNRENACGKLWTDYQRPQIEELLKPIHEASELERRYYYRMMTFIETEHLLSKIGNQLKEGSGFAAKWHDSLEEKLSAGNIYDKLQMISPAKDDKGKVERVVLRFHEKEDNDMSNFRVGDIVVLFPYQKGEEPDVRKTMAFRSTIQEITADSITLVLKNQQTDSFVFFYFGDCLWAVEHDFFESSYGAQYKGMHAFLSAPRERRDLLMLQREPEYDDGAKLRGDDYKAFGELALRVRQAKDMFLIIGPPGTGKTSFGLVNTMNEELLDEEASVLLMSFTNRAVDEICSKLVEEEKDFVRIGNGMLCAEEYKPYLMESLVDSCPTVGDFQKKLIETRIFVGTTASLNSHIELFQLKQFSLAIIDEASQILEPHLMGLLSASNYGIPAIRKFVMIGDHKQLPAVVQQTEKESKVTDPQLMGINLTDCRLSLFERLLKKYRYDPHVTYMLTRQGRMHRDIALFPNYAFYQNALDVVPLPHQVAGLEERGKGRNGIEDMLTTRRIVFLSAPLPDSSPSDKVNQTEADMIAATVAKVYEMRKDTFEATETVGVIVPYRNQIATVRNTLDAYGIDALRHITIDTVERYQGSQRDVIIYGFTIQKYYQLNFLTNNVFEEEGALIDRKLNVAMTRAREHLVMIGNAPLLGNNFTFYKLIEFIKSRQGFFEISPADYVSGNFYVEGRREADTDSIREVEMQAMGYARGSFEGTKTYFHDGRRIELTAEEQVELYCSAYQDSNTAEAARFFGNHDTFFREMTARCGGRVRMIDFGCGTASCAIAFNDVMGCETTDFRYVGIDTCSEMRKRAARRVGEVLGDEGRREIVATWHDIGNDMWESASEEPSLTVFTFFGFFCHLSPCQAEDLAARMEGVMARYPLNSYVVAISQPKADSELESYKSFMARLSSAYRYCKFVEEEA